MFYRRVVLSKYQLMLVATIICYVDIVSCYKLDTCFGISSHFQANIRLQTTVVAVIDVSLNAQKHIYKTRIINKYKCHLDCIIVSRRKVLYIKYYS